MTVDTVTAARPGRKGCKDLIPARYIVAILAFFGLCVQYTLKVNLSVAIVAMVKTNTSSDSGDDGTIDACPATESNAGDGNTTQTTGDFDWDAQTQAEVLASYYYGYVATQLLGGFLGEKYGARYICGPGLFIAGLLTVVSPWTAYVNTYFFMVVRALEGAASGVVVPSLQSLVSKWFPPEERTRLSGVIFSALNLGSVLSMGLSGILAAAGGWPLVFYFFGALAVVWFIPWIFLIYDSPDKHPRISEEEKEYILSSLGEELNAKKVAPPVPWLQLLTSVPVWTAIIFHTGTAWTMFTLLSEMPTYLKTVLHFDIAQSGLLSALPYVFCWVFGSVFGWLSQWIRGKGYLSHLAAYRVFNAVAAIGPAVAFIIITFVGCNSSVIVVLLIITTTTNSALYGGSYLNHMDLARNFAGTISGLLHTVVTSCGIFAPLAVGALINENPSLTQWNIVFYIAAGISAGTYVLYFALGSVKEQSWNTPKVEKEEPSISTITEKV
ncbi:sialin-like [Schistocerca nitens]|uniref:sialin-like n=1 Tax=Schistocerca nitens TaxID=7011 RepID=UPI00211891B2|nr:sialin-like [Schistocerca nitens]